MKEQLEQRLTALKAEFETGQKMLADQETKQAELRNTLIRISGAIQVLQEELAKANNSLEASDKLGDSGTTNANGVERLNGGGS